MGNANHKKKIKKSKSKPPKNGNKNTLDLESEINKQMNKNIFKIESHINNKKGTGFFCKIPFPTYDTPLPVLMTGYKLLTNEELYIGHKIKLKINDNKEISIIIDSDRKTYISEKYSLIIIEIKEEDNLDINSFLDIITEYKPKEMIKKKVYSIFYGKSKKELCSGVINKINIRKYKFEYSCKYKSGFRGSPIICKDNCKIIGINKGSKKDSNTDICKGVFFNQAILEFQFKFFSDMKKPEVIIEIDKITINFKINNDKITIRDIEEDMMFGEVITYFYINSTYKYDEYISFFYNGDEISPYCTETLRDLGILNNSNIYVREEKKFFDNHINVRIITGEITYNLIVNKNMKVKEMLMIFSQKFRFPYKECINTYNFMFNCKNLVSDSDITLSDFGLKDASNILIYEQI